MVGNPKDSQSVGRLLHRPHLQPFNGSEIQSDPVLPTRIKATLDQIVAFKDNPRHIENPLYAEIKESIRNRGLDHAPNVTRRDPTDPYMIKDGGNTRLQILGELWKETGEERFFVLDLMFFPWHSELDMLIGHAVENEMRGNMIFIERALHAKKIRDTIAEIEGITLSTNALAKRITKEGWSLNDSNLGQMLYAEETLFPVIPKTFWAGTGRDTVKKIRKLLDACSKYWAAVGKPDEGKFEDLWRDVFARLDGDNFDLDTAEYQLCGEMAQRMNGPVLSVTAQIQASVEGIKNIEFERPNHFEPTRKLEPIIAPKIKPQLNPTSPPVSSPSESTQKIAPQTPEKRNISSLPLSGASETSTVIGMAFNAHQPSNDYDSSTQLNAALGLRKYSLVEIPGGTPLLYTDYTVHTTEYLQMRARDTAIAYATRWGFAHNIVDTVGQSGKQIGYWVSSDGLENMSSVVRIHWAMLSMYALIRYDDRATMLLENIAKAMNGNIDTLQTVTMLMAVSHARTLVLGERARGENVFFNDVWEEISELEAIASILVTRTYEESMRIDDIADESFNGVERETGGEE